MFLSHGSGRLSTFVSNVYSLGGVKADSNILPTVAGSGHIPFFYSPTRVYCFTAPVPDKSMSHRSPLIFETCVWWGGGGIAIDKCPSSAARHAAFGKVSTSSL